MSFIIDLFGNYQKGNKMRFFRETSLEDMCLTVIISNFKTLFYHKENSDFYELFLRKKYSQRIYDKFKKIDLLEEKITNWLISPEWKEVVIEENYNLSYFVPKFRIHGKFINSVNFKNSSAKIGILSAIVCLIPNVTEINLSRTNCNDDLLLLIRKMCPHLISLHLATCQVTDIGMKNLCYVNREKVGFPSLRVLDIEGTDVKLFGIKYVLTNLHLQVLKHLDLELALCLLRIESSSESTEDSQLFKLKQLPLLHAPTSVLNLNILLNMCPYVENIRMLNALKVEDCDVLEQFRRINSLTITNLAEGNVSSGLPVFLQKKGIFLTELVLDNLIVSVGTIVKTCCNLKKLMLTSVQYQEFDETEIERKHNLNQVSELTIRSVNLNQNTNYKSINFLLKLCKNVEILTLHNVQNLQDILVDHVVSCMPNLMKAIFTYTDINLISAKKLFSCENIKYLYLDGCPYIKTDDFLALLDWNLHSTTLSWQIEYNAICESFDFF